MKQKPPRYTLDTETRRLAEMALLWATQLASVQTQDNTDMIQVIDLVNQRLGLTPRQPTPTQCDVVPLRPFRVIETRKSNSEHEPR